MTKPITVALIDIVDILIMNGSALALLGILGPLVSLPPSLHRLGMNVEDIIKKHTLPVQNGKSYYTRDVKYVKNIMSETVANPDQRRRHRDDRRRTTSPLIFPNHNHNHSRTSYLS